MDAQWQTRLLVLAGIALCTVPEYTEAVSDGGPNRVEVERGRTVRTRQNVLVIVGTCDVKINARDKNAYFSTILSDRLAGIQFKFVISSALALPCRHSLAHSCDSAFFFFLSFFFCILSKSTLSRLWHLFCLLGYFCCLHTPPNSDMGCRIF